MTNEKQPDMKRVVVYIPHEDYLQLRSKLALLGKTVSGWVRSLIKSFINTP